MVTPVPISNTEVKRLSVDGTAWETVWESRTLPDYSSKALVLQVNSRVRAFFIPQWFFYEEFLLQVRGAECDAVVLLPQAFWNEADEVKILHKRGPVAQLVRAHA